MSGNPHWSRVDELYHAARDRAPSERAAFLQAACGDDEDLRREVESLLAEVRADEFLAEPALDVIGRDMAADVLIGRTIGSYRILSLLGAGGMGEVYRARDTTLDRDVAIKVLPGSVAHDPERVARFAREARLLAALSHPHIAAIHGFEQADGLSALVMELVEGDTLADRIARGAMPVSEAITIAKQIADGLGAAHSQGIVHRDLKPSNIKLRPDGHVKILDFGLAKALAPGGSDARHSTSITGAGVVTGTPAYMSPEQAQGQPVDRRTDIWSFGCVLYEMLTGRRAFSGRTTTETIAAVVAADPKWDALPAGLRQGVRVFLQRCLAKEVNERLSDIHDMRLALDGAFDVVAPPHPRARLAPVRTAAIAVIAALLILSAGLVVWNRNGATASPSPGRIARFTVPLPLDTTLPNASNAPVVTISPDGAHVAYAAGDGLWLRPLESLQPMLVTGTQASNIHTPFFSPDGRWIGFYDESSRQLKRVAVSGGSPIVIAAMDPPSGATWTEDDVILYGRGTAGIWQVRVANGTTEAAIAVGDGEEAHSPQVLPGGKVLFTLKPRGATSWDEAHIVVQARGTTTRQVVVRGARDARYLPTGHLAYAYAEEVRVARFDPSSQRTTGEQLLTIQGVRGSLTAYTDAAQFAISTTGTLVYAPRQDRSRRTLVWVSRDGREEPIGVAYPNGSVRVSPDGTRMVLAGGRELFVSDLSRPSWNPIVPEGQSWFPVWSPDSKTIVFNWIHDGLYRITQVRPDGSERRDLLTVKASQLPGQLLSPGAWTRDGRLLFTLGTTVQPRLGLLDSDGAARGERQWTLVERPYDMSASSLSPRDDLIAYQSQYSGELRVYVDRFPNLGDPKLVSTTSGGGTPVFSTDGRELFYRRADGALMAVTIKAGSQIEIGEPVRLFDGNAYVGRRLGGGRVWDVAPDGRFIMIREVTTPVDSDELVVVQNWFEEIRAREQSGQR